MKKLIMSAITAAALLFGFAGCSGDLHDVTLIDLTGYGIIGSMTSWKTDTSLLKNNNDGTYTFEFIYSDNAAFAVNKNDDWTTAYRWDGDATAKNAVKFTEKDVPVKVYQGDSADCMTLPCASVGDTVSVLITPTSKYLEMTVSIKVAEPMYVVIDDVVMDMTPTGNEGEYSYTLTGKGSDIEFKVYDGKETYNIGSGDYATTSATLVKTKKDGKSVKLATSNGNKYSIYVTKSSEGTLSVITKDASMKTLYNIASLNSNYGNYPITWTSSSSGFTATVTIPAATSNAWGGANTADIEFGVCNDISWSTKFTGAVLLVANKAYDLEKGADANNKISGVNPSEKAVVITLVSTDEKITVSYAQ